MRIILVILISIFAYAQNFITKFENLQPYYYDHQIVNLKLKIITDSNVTLKEKNHTILLEDNNGSYIADLTFEIDNTFPIFTLKVGDIEKNITPKAEIKKLYPPKNFCGILAKEFNITDKILTNYDENNNFIYLNIKTDGNIKDFSLGYNNEKLYSVSQGIYTYSATLPINKNNFDIVYFDLNSESYKHIKFFIPLKTEEISTQTDIKPMAKDNKIIINIILFILLIIWVALYFKRRKIIYIILILIVLSILVILNLPKKEIVLKEGTKVHILPFDKSTIFLIIGVDTKVKVLDTQGKYKKIEFDNHIGWIKDN
jgi:hypothetical protein